MNVELIFRIVFWIFMLFILILNRIVPAIRAEKTGGKILPDNKAAKNEGVALFILRIFLGVFFFFLLIFYSVYPAWMDLLHVDIPLWLRWCGTFVALAGYIFWTIAQELLSRQWSPQLQIQKDHELIMTGPYHFIRHPIYSGMILWSIGLGVFTANSMFILLAILTIVWTLLRIPREEKMMIAQFGDAYRQYMQKTGRILPKLMKSND